MNFAALENNIRDTVRESITKLGYEPVPLTLYFPVEALCSLLEADMPADMIDGVLKMFAASVRETLGKITFTRAKDGRYGITVPVEGVRFVYEHGEKADFTQSLVQLMEEPDCDIMEIASLFRANGDAVIKRVQDADFDYVLYFRSGEPDEYRYCFHEEMGRMIYHRFTAKEFEKFGVDL